MKISLLQADLRWEEAAMNRELFASMIDNAPAADLFVLPEMFATGFVTRPEDVAETDGQPTLEWMRRMAARKGAAVAGSVAVADGGRFFNRFFFVKPDGGTEVYDKRHLFAMGGESGHYTAGDRRVILEYMGFRIMPLVCYDLRFPVWSRSAGECDLILYAANWPSARIGAWDALLRARAIENQCFVAGVNRVGADPYNSYDGHSAVIDYLGNEIASAGEGREAVVTAELPMEALEAFRTKFPAWMDRDKFTII